MLKPSGLNSTEEGLCGMSRQMILKMSGLGDRYAGLNNSPIT